MKNIKKIAKKSKRVAQKILYSFIVMMMVLQPVSAPGILHAIAADEADVENVSVPVSEEVEEEVEETTEESVPAVEEEPIMETVVPTEEVVPLVEETTALPIETVDNQAIEITGEGQITPEAASIVAPEVQDSAENSPKEENKKEIWTKDGDKETTTENVRLNEKYVAPQNEEVNIIFTKLPDNPGKLSIEEIILTDEQVAQFNALSNKAYDITSDMKDGTFEYDLTLPKPNDVDDVQVKYAEDVAGLESAETVSSDDVKTKANSVVAELDHFTVYVVTGNGTGITGGVTNIGLYDATLNGINGDSAANGHSFWVSLNTFSTASPTIPTGVYSTPDFGSISANAPFSATLSSIATTGVPSNLPAITPNTKYYFVAWSRVGGIWHPGDVKSFTTEAIPAPTNGQPNNAYKNTNDFYFTWDDSIVDSHPVASYEFQSSMNPAEFDGVLNTSVWLSDVLLNNTIHSTGAPDGIWYWQVRAVDSIGNKSGWSPIWNMTIDTKSPEAPQLISPADGAIVSGNPTETWSSVSDADHYFYESYSDVSGNNPVYNTNVSGISRTVGGMQTTTFYWRVKAVDAAGNESSWSEMREMTVDNTLPAMPTGLKRLSKDGSKEYACGDIAQRQTLIPIWDDMAAGDSSFDHYEYVSFKPDGNIGTTQNLTVNKFDHNWVPTEDGTNGYVVRTVDKAGNVSNWALSGKSLAGSCQINYDSTAPFVEITNPTESLLTGSVEVRGTVTDAHPHHYWLQIKKNGSVISNNTVNESNSFTNRLLTTLTDDGDYEVTLAARDAIGGTASSGNRSADVIKSFTIDNSVPTVDLVFPAIGSGATSFQAVFSEDVDKDEAEDPTNYFLNNWPGAGSDGDLVGDATVSYDSGTKTATIQFTDLVHWHVSPEQQWGVQDIHDLAGNLQSVNPYIEYSTPMIAPATTDDIADSNWHNSVTVNLSCTDTDGSGCKTTYYTTDGSDPNTSSSTGNSFTLSVDGVYVIKYFSVDNAGNVESVKTAVNQIKIDTVAPTVVSVDSDDATYNLATPSPQEIKITFDEDIFNTPAIAVNLPTQSQVVDDCSDGDAKTFCFDYTINTGEELTHTIYISGATDLAGNIMTQDSTHTFDVDTLAPTVTFIDPTPSDGLITNNHDQTFQVSVDEPVSSCTLNFNGNYIERQIANGLSDGLGFSYVISGDDQATIYGLPFNFPFYGNLYNSLSVSTNALLRFNSSADNSLGNSDSALISRVGVATLWDDIVTSVYASSSSDNVRFRWTGTGWSTGGYLTNEAVLRSNGTVELHYGDINLPSRNITAGLSAGNGTDYVFSSVNGQSVISPVSYAYSPGATATFPMDLKLDGTYSVTVSGMNDGVTNYSVVCTDLAQNDGTSESRSVTIDTVAPTATISYSTTNWTNGDVTVTLNPSELVTITNNPGNTTYSFTDNGSFTFEFVDLAGNTGSATATVSNIDKTAPIIDAGTDKLVNAQFTQEATVDGSISAVASYAWSQISGPGTITFGTLDAEDTSVSADADGTYVIRLTVVDNAGNSAYDEFTLIWDKTLPEVTLAIDPATNDGDNGWYVSNPEITLTATDDNGIEKIEYQLNSDLGAWTAYTGPVTIADGTWQFYYRGIDKASNISSMGPKDVKVDTNDPDNVSNFEGEYRSDTTDVKLTWNADNSNIHKVYIYRGGSRSFSVNSGSRIAKNDDNDEDYTDDDIELGETYYYKILTTDEAGNKSDVRIIKIVIPEDETSNAVSVDEGTETLPEGTVLGTEAGDENKGDENKDDEGVLGEQNRINGGNNSGKSSIFDKWPWFLLAIIILGGIWYIFGKRKKSQNNAPKLD